MASTKKTPPRGKQTTTRRRTKAKSGNSEAKYLILAAVGVLMALSVYIEGWMGFFGPIVSGFLTGLFGFGAYVLPPAIVAIAVYGLFAHSKTSKFKKISSTLIVQGICLLWAVISFMHILTVPEQDGLGLWAYIQLLYAQGSGANGGLLGGLLGNVLRRLLGYVGAYIVLVIATIVIFVLITGRSFSQALAKVWEAINSRVPEEDYEEDEDEDEEDDDEPVSVPGSRILKPLPPKRTHNKKKVKTKGNILDIRDVVQKREGKILLFHEDLGYDHKFAPKSKVLPFKTPEEEPVLQGTQEAPSITGINDSEPVSVTPPSHLEEDDVADIADTIDTNMDMDITVKGLVVEESVPEPVFVPATPAVPTPPAVAPAPTPVAPVATVAVPASAEATVISYENYQFPPLNLLTRSPDNNPTESRTQILENSRILEETLRSFKIEAKVIEVSVGPTVTRYDMSPGPGVKVATISNLSNDLALSLAAQGIRIEAPIPGKAAVGIEIPNKEPQAVLLRDILESEAFDQFPSNLAFAVGKDIAGSPIITDVAKMPHLLIAGSTGSGKSVCINTLIASILYKAHPDDVKLIMVDPKVVELSLYNGIPHLMVPVVTDPKKASDALQWAVAEMEQRYQSFAEVGVRDLKGYNHHILHVADPQMDEDGNIIELKAMPQIVIIIDELADLMMTCKGAVEESICRLAQKARAAGIHMVLATQRPSVDVITGLIKANVPSRLAFAVSSGTDSRTVLDMVGAEKLLGKGDMLFLPVGQNKPTRLQGGFISDKEVEQIVNFLKTQVPTVYSEELVQQVTSFAGSNLNDEDLDEFFYEATEFLIEKGKASTSMLQRQFRIGYNRASRLMEDLEKRGIVGPEDGVKPRKVNITWEEYQETYGR